VRTGQLSSQDSVHSTHTLHLTSQDSVRSDRVGHGQESLHRVGNMYSQDSLRGSVALAGQDSVDSVSHHQLYRSPAHIPSNTMSDKVQHHPGETVGERHQNIAIMEENKVKIQVPGLPATKPSSPAQPMMAQNRTHLAPTSATKSDEH